VVTGKTDQEKETDENLSGCETDHVLWILSPLAFLYQFFFLLNSRLTPKKRLQNAFVVSVGNLSVGGTGKTPVTQFLAHWFQREFPELPLCFLSRGYGGTASTRGQEVFLDSLPQETGEEAILHKLTFPRARVLIGRDRYRIFQASFPDPPKQVVLLDDGFQHHALDRDLDLVLLDCTRGLENGWTLPLGRLREPASHLRRADALLFTKYRGTENDTSFVERTKQMFPEIPSFRFTQENPILVWGIPEPNPHPTPREGSAVFVAGLGNPKEALGSFQSLWKGKISKTVFPRDHYAYRVEDLRSYFVHQTDWIVTTRKDFVKWKAILESQFTPKERAKVLVLESTWKVLEEELWSDFLKTAISDFLKKT